MSIDSVPIWVLFVGTIFIVMASIEAGHRLGTSAHLQSEDEKESPVSGVSGAILGLTAFMLVFTFGIVANRYDDRKALVREDANSIRTAYARTAFLPEPDRTEAKALLGRYLDLRVAFAQAQVLKAQSTAAWLADTNGIQRRLWDMAVANAEKDMTSDVAALYIESLNELSEVNATRIAVALQARIPSGIWLVLFGLTMLGMISIGYHMGIVGSNRSKATVILAISFAMMIVVIAALDRPGAFAQVTQQPLLDLQEFIAGNK